MPSSRLPAAKATPLAVVPTAAIEECLLILRGERVMLDRTLARLYGVSTGDLNQAVRRNLARFPVDFAFQVTPAEAARLISQSVITNSGRGGTRHLPFAFTEQGVAMLSSVLRSPRAVLVNIEIMRAFVRIRRLLASHADLAGKLTALEQRYDAQFRIVFDAIRALMEPLDEAEGVSPVIGFR